MHSRNETKPKATADGRDTENETIYAKSNDTQSFDFPIPGGLNLILLGLAILSCLALLWFAVRLEVWWQVALVALGFSFTANTVFSLLHEAVHGVFHANPVVNRWAGRLAAAFFPTAFSLQRAFHLLHHRDNRSVRERFDYIQPGEIAWLKYAQWYAILTGIYWFVSVIGVALYFFIPAALRTRRLRSTDSTVARQTASASYLAVFDQLHPVVTRLEVLMAWSIQAALFFALDLSVLSWLVCYAAFGLHWSSLQYADHAFSPLDRDDGAWNLRVNFVSRAFFLNYHYHLAHHRQPGVPWLYLGRLIRPEEPFPSYFRVWLSMWRGPRPLPAPVDSPGKAA